MKSVALATLAALALLGWPGFAAAEAPGLPGSFEEAGRMVDYWTGRLRSLGAEIAGQVQTGRAPRGPMEGAAGERLPGEGPLITIMLHHRDELALTPDQVTRLEALRGDFARDAIRRDADIRIAELDLATLLQQEPVDVEKAAAKIRELAQLRADLRIARIRTIEQGKAVLTPEQRGRLQALVGGMPHGPGGMPGPGGPRPRRSADSGARP